MFYACTTTTYLYWKTKSSYLLPDPLQYFKLHIYGCVLIVDVNDLTNIQTKKNA